MGLRAEPLWVYCTLNSPFSGKVEHLSSQQRAAGHAASGVGSVSGCESSALVVVLLTTSHGVSKDYNRFQGKKLVRP